MDFVTTSKSINEVKLYYCSRCDLRIGDDMKRGTLDFGHPFTIE